LGGLKDLGLSISVMQCRLKIAIPLQSCTINRIDHTEHQHHRFIRLGDQGRLMLNNNRLEEISIISGQVKNK